MATSTEPLKIGLVLDTSLDTAEGVPQYVMALGEWLRSKGHDVHYLVGQTEKRQLPNIHSLSRNIAVRFNGNRTNIPLPTSRHKLRRFIQQEQFDVLHVQTPHHPLLAQRLILAAGPQTAVIGTFHVLPYGSLSRYGNKALGVWLKPSLKRFDKMLAVSPAAADYARWSFGAKAEVVPNMIDYDLFHNAKPFDKYNDGKLNILFLGRLVPRKGCLVLLEAISRITKLGYEIGLPEFRLIICGRGPLEKELKHYAYNNDLGDIIEFTGFVDEADKPRYYASADLAVFPSSGGESFGIVLLEAMAGGRTAVLAGNNPGYHSVMGAQPDLLFDPLDADALAEKLKLFMLNVSGRKQMAQWGADYARAFDTETVGQKIIEIYRSALRKRKQL
jgi:phosphatidylinositol alpha-mannosyltransferase